MYNIICNDMFLCKDYPFEDDSSSDSDSDDVQIHIGQIRTTPFSQLVFSLIPTCWST